MAKTHPEGHMAERLGRPGATTPLVSSTSLS
jgi:hypothetical protein